MCRRPLGNPDAVGRLVKSDRSHSIDPFLSISQRRSKAKYFGNIEIHLGEHLSHRRRVRPKDCTLRGQSLSDSLAELKQSVRVTTFSHTIVHPSPFESGRDWPWFALAARFAATLENSPSTAEF